VTPPIIQADYRKLETIARAFHSASDDNRARTAVLVDQVARVRRGLWDSESADYFYVEMQQHVVPALERLTKAFTSAGQGVEQIIQIMRQAEQEAAGQLPHQMDGVQASGTLMADEKFRLTGTVSTPNGSLFIHDPLDGNAIHPSDARQGSLGDCYLVASLAAIARQNPDAIRNAIRDNGDGTYTVTLHEDMPILGALFGMTRTVEITVNGDLPTGERLQPDGTWKPVMPHILPGDRADGRQEMWAQIYEKAYAQHRGNGSTLQNYDRVEGGLTQDALFHLTGQRSQVYRNPESLNITDLARLNDEGHAITLHSLMNGGGARYQNDQLVTKHAYYITEVDTTTGMVTIENPWGWGANRVRIPYSELGENFSGLVVNPITPR
jgi:WXG100 family type VII secretion target